jgi:hypothetical protein
MVSSRRQYAIYAVLAAAIAVLFAAFIGFRHDAALIGALSAAGTVAAAAFAALAAVGSMRAAAESSAAARRTHEAVVRSAQPFIAVTVSGTDGVVTVRGRSASDLTAVWMFDGLDGITERAARLEPGDSVTVALPEGVQPAMVWIEYWDGDHVGHWHDTWSPSDSGQLTRTDSSLKD